jgi:response regulator RpfG family c-di-GMP phosphodiesterase
MSIHTDLRSVIYALSDALDLVGVDDVAHGKRVGIMAAECAAELGLGGQEQDFLFDLGMLHDIGVSSTGIHRNLVEQFDWAGSQQHAETGYALLKDYAPLAAMAVPVRYHHTHWSQLQDKGLDPAVARAANLIFLVDRVDALAAPHYASNGVLPHMHQIRDEIARNAGGRFAPELVAAFLTASAREAFWLRLEPRSIQAALQDRLALAGEGNAPTGSLRELARIFSRIVDAKSPFTAEHSLGVAGVACLLARRLGVASDNVDKLEIAALLHDLGKLRVPDEISTSPESSTRPSASSSTATASRPSRSCATSRASRRSRRGRRTTTRNPAAAAIPSTSMPPPCRSRRASCAWPTSSRPWCRIVPTAPA